MTERRTDATALDEHWTPPPPIPDDVAKAIVDVIEKVAEESDREDSFRTVVEDAKTLVQIAKLMDTLEPYTQRATLDWLKAYYDEVC